MGVTQQLKTSIAHRLGSARRRTALLTESVDDVDLVRQHSPLMSPLVWDLAHVGNQEEQWLLRDVGGREPVVGTAIDDLYDAFKHPRSGRPALPLMEPAQARRYAADVRARVLDVLDVVPLEGSALVQDGFAFGMIIQHEQQHDETMLATHQLRHGEPVLSAPPPPQAADVSRVPDERLVPAGPFTMGTSTEPWALDNERPAHVVDLDAFWIDTFPVTNAAYRQFVDDGGYEDPRLWADAGWAQRQRESWQAPLFWSREAGAWTRRRFGMVEPVPDDEPVQHVSWFEADAYARWAGKRLPTEAEWEKAARHDPVRDRSRRYPWGDDDPTPDRANLGQRHLQPAPVGAYPAGASAYGVQQMVGDVWEWTATEFAGYPGFVAWPYREYSEVFFGQQLMVLRGGAWSVDPVACRGTFRNWDLPIRRQIFAGFRCARDAPEVA